MAKQDRRAFVLYLNRNIADGLEKLSMYQRRTKSGLLRDMIVAECRKLWPEWEIVYDPERHVKGFLEGKRANRGLEKKPYVGKPRGRPVGSGKLNPEDKIKTMGLRTKISEALILECSFKLRSVRHRKNAPIPKNFTINKWVDTIVHDMLMDEARVRAVIASKHMDDCSRGSWTARIPEITLRRLRAAAARYNVDPARLLKAVVLRSHHKLLEL